MSNGHRAPHTADMDTANLLWGLAQWTIASTFVGALSLRAARRLNPGPTYLVPALALLLWVMGVSALVLALASAGWLRGTPVAAAAAAGLAALAAAAWRRRARVVQAAAGRPAAAVRLDRSERTLLALLAAAAAAQALRLAVHVWVLPPYSWDALVYRLPKVAEWVQRGGFGTWETPVARSFWPANYELLESWFALFTHHDVIVDAASLPLYGLAVCAVYAIARGLQLGAVASAAAAALYAFTPAVALHAASVNNDLAVAAPYLLIAALVLAWRNQPRHTTAHIAVMAAAALYALGAKAYIVFIGPGLALLAVWAVATRRRTIAADGAGPGAALPAALLMLGLLLGGFWYVRNAIVFGNPFYPTDFVLFGHLLAGDGSGAGQQGTFSLDSLSASLSALWNTKLYDLAGPYLPDVNNMTGWGWFTFTCGPPALVLALLRRSEMRWVTAAFALSLVSLLGWVSTDAFNMRFTLWFPALAAVSFAVMLAELRLRAVRLAFIALAVLCSTLNYLGTLNPGVISLQDWRAMLQLPAAQRSAAALLASSHRVGPSFRDALAAVPPGEPLGYAMRDNSVIYLLYGADLSRRLIYVPVRGDERITGAMAQRGLRYLFAWRPGDAQRTAIDAALKLGRLTPVGEGLYERTD